MDDFVRELDVAGEVVFLDGAREVCLDFGTTSIESGPVGVGLKGDFLGVSVGILDSTL